MPSDMTIIYIMLSVNLLVVLGMLMAPLIDKKLTQATANVYALFFLFCPVVGVTSFLCVQLIILLFSSKQLDISNLSFDKERKKAVMPPDASAEMNYVPILDALTTQDKNSLRRLLLDLLKNRNIMSTHSVSVAVNSMDAETSHYAATALTDFLSEFRSTAQRLLMDVRQAPRDVTKNLKALEYLHQILALKVMDDIEQRSYIYTLDGVAENLFQNNKWYMTSEHFLWMTDHLLEIGDYVNARKWVERAEQCRPDDLDTYKCAIHLYYQFKDYKALYATTDRLRASEIVIDKELLNLLRMLDKREGE